MEIIQINNVSVKIVNRDKFYSCLDKNIVSIDSLELSIDNINWYKNFPSYKELICDISDSLMTPFFEALFLHFGKDKEYLYTEMNEGFNLRFVKRNYFFSNDVCNLDLIQQIFNKNNISEEKLLIHTNNLNLELDWPYKFKHLTSMMITIFNYPSTEYVQKKFEKKFIFLNRNHKPHRKLLYEAFYKLDILDNFYYSINSVKNPFYNISIDLDNGSDIENALGEQKEYLNKSFCNIITESEFFSSDKNTSSYKSIHITEKTMKALNNFQPFILVSGYKSLQKLKEYGFKTFDKWWDESYDIENDDYIRLNKIIELVQYINKLPMERLYEIQNEMKDILIHNANLYHNFSDIEFHYSKTFIEPYCNYKCLCK